MSRDTRVECPLTGTGYTLETEAWEQPTYDVDDEETRNGWGAVALSLCVRNPAYAAVEASRAAYLEQVTIEHPEASHDALILAVNRDLPLPIEFLRASWAIRDLSPAAMLTVRDALGAAGLVLEAWPDAK